MKQGPRGAAPLWSRHASQANVDLNRAKPRSSASSAFSRFPLSRADARRPPCEEAGADATSLIAFPRRPVIDGDAEVQMLLRRIHSPTHQCAKERHQSGKSSDSLQDLPEAVRQ